MAATAARWRKVESHVLVFSLLVCCATRHIYLDTREVIRGSIVVAEDSLASSYGGIVGGIVVDLIQATHLLKIESGGFSMWDKHHRQLRDRCRSR